MYSRYEVRGTRYEVRGTRIVLPAKVSSYLAPRTSYLESIFLTLKENLFCSKRKCFLVEGLFAFAAYELIFAVHEHVLAVHELMFAGCEHKKHNDIRK
jgi:hypothetical protein